MGTTLRLIEDGYPYSLKAMIVKCKIPNEQVTDEIRWLGAEKADGGFYLYQYEDPALPCKWDAFYQTLGDLADCCEEGWGIKREAWPELASLDETL